MLNTFLSYLFDFKTRFLANTTHGVYNHVSDENFLRKKYKLFMGKELNLDNPQTFNEKLQWLKLHDRKSIYTTMVDKYEAKKYVANIIGDEYIIPTLGVWDRFDDIDFDKLPDQFVLKCTHDSGGLVICKDKSKLDLKAAKKKIEKSLSTNYYLTSREWPYKNVKRKVIAEQYMCDSKADQDNLTDYKIFCFDGVPEYIMTVRDRQKGHGNSLHRWYDTDWVLQDVDLDHRGEEKIPEQRPEKLDEMLQIAQKLSAGMKHLRVDLYIINGKVYFGEMTLYHMSGFEEWEPAYWDKKLGDLINLDDIK